MPEKRVVTPPPLPVAEFADEPPPLPKRAARKRKHPSLLWLVPAALCAAIFLFIVVDQVGTWVRNRVRSNEPKYVHIDLHDAKDEIVQNRPGWLNRHVGKMVRIEVGLMFVAYGDEDFVAIAFSDADNTGKERGVFYKGEFAFGHPKNTALKTLKRGRYRGVICGRIEGVRLTERFTYIELTSAWVEGDLVLLEERP